MSGQNVLSDLANAAVDLETDKDVAFSSESTTDADEISRRETIPIPNATVPSGAGRDIAQSVQGMDRPPKEGQYNYELRHESAHRQLARQLPKDDTHLNNKTNVKPKFWIDGKTVQEWTEHEVTEWLKNILARDNTKDENGDKFGLTQDSTSHYIWCFQSNHVTGESLMNSINNINDLTKLGISDTTVETNSKIAIILDEINVLKAKMKIEIKNLNTQHPIRRSKFKDSYDASGSGSVINKIEPTYILGALGRPGEIDINGNNNNNNNSSNNDATVGAIHILPKFRFNGLINLNMKLKRMKFYMFNLFLFCIFIIFPSFIDNADIGAGIASVACLNGLFFASLKMRRNSKKLEQKTKEYLILETELHEKANDPSFYTMHGTVPDDIENELARDAENMYEEFDGSDPRRHSKNQPSFRFNLEHPLDIIGCFSFVVSIFVFAISRFWAVDVDDTEQFLYAIAMGVFFGGQCILIIWDIAYIGLFDGKRRRILLLSFIHSLFCLFGINYYEIRNDLFIGLCSYISAAISLIIFIYLIACKTRSHKENRFVISHRCSYVMSHLILILYLITIIAVAADFNFKFYPTKNGSYAASIGWLLWTLIFTVLYSLDINQWLLSPSAFCHVQS